MARNDTAREQEQSLLDRRSYLKMTGAAAASVLGTKAMSGSASAAEYETVTVPAGGHESFTLRDGDTLENVLIDITADGAQYTIDARGDGWAIRNVGVRGVFDTNSKVEPFYVMGNGTIENLYLGDGDPMHTGGATGIYVSALHAGEINIDGLNVQGWSDNGVYGSSPGNDDTHTTPGRGGVVTIENSYGRNNATANFRLGTDGSYCKNCVSVGGDKLSTRTFWAYYHDTKLIDCDLTGEHVLVGEDGHEGGREATLTLENCRYDVQVLTDAAGNSVTGESQGQPDTTPPEGCPMSAEEAASGTSSAGGSGGSSGSGGDSNDGSDEETTTETGDGEGTVLELIAEPNTSNVSYEFTVEGSVSKNTTASDNSADTNDSVTDNGDGTVTVSGVAGNGYGDAFFVNGDIVSMDVDESQWTLRYGGEEVSVSDLVLPNKLVIDGSDTSRVASTYTFTVSGQARKIAALGSVNSYDTISDGEISGRVIAGADGYRFSGDITGFNLDGPAKVRVEDNA